MPGTSACAQRGSFFLLSLISVGVTASAAVGAGDDTQPKAVQPKDGLPVPPGAPKDPQPEAKRQAAAPDPRVRLDEERRRISAAAAAAGTDPTAIIGYYQLSFGHNDFSRGLSSNAATAVVRLPLTPNWLVQVTLPYVWADLNGRRSFSADGTSDLVLRTGGRLYASTDVALFAGLDASFPAASDRRLGTGKYTLGPGLAVAAPLPRLRSLSLLLIENFNSVGGDPSRADLHYLQIQGGFNTLWSEHWWTLLTGTWSTDWNNRRRPTLNLVGQLGYRFDDHWNLFVGGGGGVVGQDTFLGLDWNVQAGVRWVFDTPLISETFFGGPAGPQGGSSP